MSIYKQANQLKLRFETSRGVLSVEQLFDLSRNQLAHVVRNLKKKLNEVSGDDELSFLDDSATKVDEITQLQFDIAKDVYLTKKAEADAVRIEAENKAHNQKILELIQGKKEESLKNLSVEELEKLLK